MEVLYTHFQFLNDVADGKNSNFCLEGYRYPSVDNIIILQEKRGFIRVANS